MKPEAPTHYTLDLTTTREMASQYDEIGLAYESVKRFPAAVLERKTFQSVIQPLLSSRRDVGILDLACGTGYYTRLLAEWGGDSVSRILGIDLSPVMVEAARANMESSTSLSSPLPSQRPSLAGRETLDKKITFQVGDCTQPLKLGLSDAGGPFSIVTGAWLLNYASSQAFMTEMWRNVAQNLADGGVFVGITPYPAMDLDAFAAAFAADADATAQTNYGATVQYTSPTASGDGYATKVTVHTEPVEVVFENFHLRRDVYERSAREGGMMGQVVWIEPRLPSTDDESRALYSVDLAWWDDYRLRMHFGIMMVGKS